MVNIANILSGARLLIAPLMLVCAWTERAGLFLVCWVAALASDALDGYIARRLNQVTELGARLDSWGDWAIYLCVPLSIWWLWPGIIFREAVYVAVILASLIIPVLCGYVKFRRLTSYHTWGSKTSAFLLSTTILVMIFNGPSWPFRLSTVFFVFSALEEIAVTLMLDSWQADVSHIFEVLRRRRMRLKNRNPDAEGKDL